MLVPIENPLKTHVIIGRHIQLVIYERFNILCTSCGRLGHNQTSFPTQKAQAEYSNEEEPVKNSNEVKELTNELDQWTIISHKRKPKPRMGGATFSKIHTNHGDKRIQNATMEGTSYQMEKGSISFPKQDKNTSEILTSPMHNSKIQWVLKILKH